MLRRALIGQVLLSLSMLRRALVLAPLEEPTQLLPVSQGQERFVLVLMFVLVLPLMEANPGKTPCIATNQGPQALCSYRGSLEWTAGTAKLGPRLEFRVSTGVESLWRGHRGLMKGDGGAGPIEWWGR
ncbi:hypothetical protein KUCAC02_028698 [Chaenocephalus aceratus]|uniref:Uncharacterized protein n=1 Tax=Chaenocephalus aceratus TaxID=36190 RepID=A0ACB9X3S4_CHAAC|nr:hypothetical protein KUCAC02_028698 [Chaenocephalus aceratus]